VRLIAPVVTTTSIILSSNKPTNSDSPGKAAIKTERKRVMACNRLRLQLGCSAGFSMQHKMATAIISTCSFQESLGKVVAQRHTVLDFKR